MSAARYQDEILTSLTRHARERMTIRSINAEAVHAALDFGRIARVRGAEIYAIGRKEVERASAQSIDLSSHEGVQVVCSTDGAVLTVYRNRSFRGLRPRRRRRRAA